MSESSKFQYFLDNGQYSKHRLEKYEWIFGETFLSTGGIATTAQVLKYIHLGREPKVLDLGSGLGGHSFLLAEKFRAKVVGLDLSANMIEIARRHLENRSHLKENVEFKIEDYTKIDFPKNNFDLVYSRDSFLHVEDKIDLFKKIFKSLKPGGYALFTDYVRGEDEKKYSEEFWNYLNERGYHLATISEYKKVLKASGFNEIRVEDWRKEFKDGLEVELNKLRKNKKAFLQQFSQEDYDDLESGWVNKIERANGGYQGWVLGLARKQQQQ